jgi:hypothetical protein
MWRVDELAVGWSIIKTKKRVGDIPIKTVVEGNAKKRKSIVR